MKKLIIATRTSDLALWQAYHIKARIEASYPEITVELNKIVSKILMVHFYLLFAFSNLISFIAAFKS